MEASPYVLKGTEKILFDLPKRWNLLSCPEPREVMAAEDEMDEIRKAIENPIGSRAIRQLAARVHKVAILTDDATRPTRSYKIIPLVLDELGAGGIKDEDVVVVVAKGSHEHNTREEVKAKIGEESFNRVKVIQHDHLSSCAYLGETSRKTPLWINETVMKADLKIGIGNVTPHQFAGYGGGAKIILPGVAGRETIVSNHVLLRNPRSRDCVVDGNPVREDIDEAARLAGLDVIVNVVMDTHKRVVKAVAGDPSEAFKEGVRVCKKVYAVNVPQESDVTITSHAPYYMWLPLVAIVRADTITKNGGAIIGVCGPVQSKPANKFCLLPEKAKQAGAAPAEVETIENKVRIFRDRTDTERIFEKLRKGVREEDPEIKPYVCPHVMLGMYTMLNDILKVKQVIFVAEDSTQRENIENVGWACATSMEEAFEIAKVTPKEADVNVLPAGSGCVPYANNK